VKRKTTIEYEVRTIDADGDACDLDSFRGRTGKRQAIEFAKRQVAWCETMVVERVVWWLDDDEQEVKRRTYTTMWMGGDRERLKAGGWLEDESDTLSDESVNGGAA
jgi:hypothetical protein